MYYYILNPTAGNGSVNQIQEKLRLMVKELGIGGEFAKTTGPDDAARMAHAAISKGFNTIVAVGGDGTVNEVVNGVRQANVAVGIVPIGRTNSLAKRLGINSWQQAVGVLAQRRITSLSLIAAGSDYFLSNLTIGFENTLAQTLDHHSGPDLKSRFTQAKASWGQAKEFKPLKCYVTTDQFELESEVFTLSVSNQKFNNPLADNRLVISIEPKPSSTQLTKYLWRQFRGQDTSEEPHTRFTASKAQIDTKPTSGLMIDGKAAGRTPISIRLTDRQVRFITEKPTSEFKS
jgi:diacylglycerol kinase (ATP)